MLRTGRSLRVVILAGLVANHKVVSDGHWPVDAPRQELRDELLRLHARVLLRMPFFQLALVLAIAFIVLPHVPGSHFALWAVFALAVEFLRMGSGRLVLRAEPAVAATRQVFWYFMALDVLAGVSIGAAGLWFVPALPLLHQMLLETTLYVVAAAGAVVTISGALMPELYSSVILAAAAVSWALQVPADAAVVGGLTALCWVFLLLVGRESAWLLSGILSLRHDKDAALASLAAREAELREAYATMQRKVDARNRVMATASHDLRQPLSALSVYGAVLASRQNDEILATLSRNIQVLVRDLGHILDELLHLSSLDSGTYKLTPEPTDLCVLTALICDRFGSAARGKGLSIAMALEPARLCIDRVAYERILGNLLDNALKFTVHGGVRVELNQRGGSTALAVQDTGCGIASAQQAQVFDDFYQIERAGSGERLGVGLGLPIARRLCDMTGGELKLSSQAGTGSRFTVTWRSANPP